VLKYSIKNIVLKQNKVSIMLDKSTTVSDKIVPIACSRTAVGESTYQGLLISKFKTVKFRAKTNSIYDSIVDFLQKYGLSSFFFSMALQPNADLRLIIGLLPVSSVFRPLSNL
jgi:hypothetical protein